MPCLKEDLHFLSNSHRYIVSGFTLLLNTRNNTTSKTYTAKTQQMLQLGCLLRANKVCRRWHPVALEMKFISTVVKSRWKFASSFLWFCSYYRNHRDNWKWAQHGHEWFVSVTNKQGQSSNVNKNLEAFDTYLLAQLKQEYLKGSSVRGGWRLLYFQEQGN